MNINKKRTSRRIVLKRVTCSSALIGLAITPKKWSKPVVNSVLLPSHATTSMVSPTRGMERFDSPGAASFMIPEGVTSISLTVAGAGGAGGYSGTGVDPGGNGGNGGLATMTVNVTPLSLVAIFVGSGGISMGGSGGLGDGAGGNGSSGLIHAGGGGGGASSASIGGTTLRGPGGGGGGSGGSFPSTSPNPNVPDSHAGGAGGGTNGAPGVNGLLNAGTVSAAPTEGTFSGGDGGLGGGTTQLFRRNGGNGGDGAGGAGGLGNTTTDISPGTDGRPGFVLISY